MTGIQPELWSDRAAAAVAFYESAFGARVLHQVGEGDEIVAQLAIGDAAFWVSFDPATGVTTVTGLLPGPRADLAAAAAGGRQVLLGGSTPHGPTAEILRFDPARQAITLAGRLPAPSTDGAVAAVGDNGYLVGGLSATGPLDQIVVITLRLISPARSAG